MDFRYTKKLTTYTSKHLFETSVGLDGHGQIWLMNRFMVLPLTELEYDLLIKPVTLEKLPDCSKSIGGMGDPMEDKLKLLDGMFEKVSGSDKLDFSNIQINCHKKEVAILLGDDTFVTMDMALLSLLNVKQVTKYLKPKSGNAIICKFADGQLGAVMPMRLSNSELFDLERLSKFM